MRVDDLLLRAPYNSPSAAYPLPPGWKQIYSHNHQKYFFVNAKTKERTWCDPRDQLWKKASWKDCDMRSDETPYGNFAVHL
jgi:hypothetical protein